MKKRGRPASRIVEQYEPPPRPQQVQWVCQSCRVVNLVWLDDALYLSVAKGVACCARCGTRLGGGISKELER